MADQVAELQGLRIKLHDLGNGIFQPAVHRILDPTGVRDSSIEWQGFRIMAHDNGDGTFAFVVNPGDVVASGPEPTLEIEGVRIGLTPIAGKFVTIGGGASQLYAIRTGSGLPSVGDFMLHVQGFYLWVSFNGLAEAFELALAIGGISQPTDQSLEWEGFRLQLVDVGPVFFAGGTFLGNDAEAFSIGAFQI